MILGFLAACFVWFCCCFYSVFFEIKYDDDDDDDVKIRLRPSSGVMYAVIGVGQISHEDSSGQCG